MKRRIVILSMILAVAALFFSLGLHQYLTLDALKARQVELAALAERRPLPVIAGFMLVLVAALALCLPGAVLSMALAGGAIFGQALGTAVVLASLTIGDSLGFLIARYLLGDWVHGKFRTQFETIERGIEADGIFYLLSLRLMAFMPYFVVNWAMGLTRMPLRVFAPVSFIGLIPAAALYVNAGTQLAGIATPSDVITVQLIGTFTLLALLPLAARFLYRRRGITT